MSHGLGQHALSRGNEAQQVVDRQHSYPVAQRLTERQCLLSMSRGLSVLAVPPRKKPQLPEGSGGRFPVVAPTGQRESLLQIRSGLLPVPLPCGHVAQTDERAVLP